MVTPHIYTPSYLSLGIYLSLRASLSSQASQGKRYTFTTSLVLEPTFIVKFCVYAAQTLIVVNEPSVLVHRGVQAACITRRTIRQIRIWYLPWKSPRPDRIVGGPVQVFVTFYHRETANHHCFEPATRTRLSKADIWATIDWNYI